MHNVTTAGWNNNDSEIADDDINGNSSTSFQYHFVPTYVHIPLT